MTTPTKVSRRHWWLLASAVAASSRIVAAPQHLPTTKSLSSELAKSLARQSPLLVMVSLDGCPFCKIVRENYLGPMREREGLTVVQIDMRSKAELTDFRGKLWTHDELIRSWGIKVAPTVLFFGKGGAEVAERMVGGYIPDFYGSYLEERLRIAHAALSA